MQNQLKSVAWVAALLCAGIANGQSADVIRRGKQATALVVVKQGDQISSGTAFCVSSDGFFITNAHVIPEGDLQETTVETQTRRAFLPGRGIVDITRERVSTRTLQGGMSLILNPGEANQQVYYTYAVKIDRKSDLAVLVITPEQPLVGLELGKVDGLVETSTVIAFGYPFGQILAGKGNDYPNISVNVGRVTSLRKIGGELSAIQLDAALNPGNSGGPVLDNNGRVVGIVEKGIPGASVNFAIPVTKLTQLLEAPVGAMTGSPPDPETATKPMEFTIKMLLTWAKGMPDAKVELDLTNDKLPTRTYSATRAKDGMYKVSAPALAETKAADHPNLDHHDVTFAIVVKRQGQEDAKTVGWFPVALSAAERPVVAKTPAAAPSTRVSSRRGARPVLPGLPDATPVTEADHQVIKLPARVEKIVSGDNGRYLVLWMPQARQLGIFDAQASRVRFIPRDDVLQIAASRVNLFIASSAKNGSIEATTLGERGAARDRTKPMPDAAEVVTMAAGDTGIGPLLVLTRTGPQFINMVDLTPSHLQIDNARAWPQWADPKSCWASASADGKTFIVSNSDERPQSVYRLRITGQTARATSVKADIGLARPTADGGMIIGERGILDDNLHPVSAAALQGLKLLPVHSGGMFLGIAASPAQEINRVGLFSLSDQRQVLSLPIPPEIATGSGNSIAHGGPSPSDRIHLVPTLNLMLNLDSSCTQLIIRQLDIRKRLAEPGNDYLFVGSAPISFWRPGLVFIYGIQVNSKNGGVTYSLQDGPSGMTVSQEGRVEWMPDQATNDNPIPVAIRIKDKAGHEIVHSFKIWRE